VCLCDVFLCANGGVCWKGVGQGMTDILASWFFQPI